MRPDHRGLSNEVKVSVSILIPKFKKIFCWLNPDLACSILSDRDDIIYTLRKNTMVIKESPPLYPN